MSKGEQRTALMAELHELNASEEILEVVKDAIDNIESKVVDIRDLLDPSEFSRFEQIDDALTKAEDFANNWY